MIALSLLLGYLVKTVDLSEEHGLRLPRTLVLLLSAAYGFLIALLIHSHPQITPLYLAVVAAVALSGKIDAPSHYLAIAVFVAAIAYYSLPQFSPPLLVFFLAAALLDEFGNSLCDSGKLSVPLLSAVFKHRLALNIAAALAFAFTGEPLLLVSIVLFDLGYQAAPYLTGRKPRG